MKLEPGKHYKDRSGYVWYVEGPVMEDGWVWCVDDRGMRGLFVARTGRYTSGDDFDTPFDIVEESVDTIQET